MKIDTLLHEEIRDELQELNKIEVGTEKYKVTVDGIAKLMDKAIELEKIEVESHDRMEAREADIQLKTEQIIEDKKDRFAKNVLSALGIALPLGVTIWGTLKSFKFEEEGTITTTMGRGFINKLLPKK